MVVIWTEENNRFRDVKGRFASLRGEGVAERSREHMRNVGRMFVQSLRQEAPSGAPDPLGRPPSKQYRKLNENIRYRTFVTANEIRLRIYAPIQAVYTIRGVKAHDIPRPGETLAYPLHFWWDKLNKEVWFWKVHHKGYKGDRWDLRAAARIRAEARAELGKGFIYVMRMMTNRE